MISQAYPHFAPTVVSIIYYHQPTPTHSKPHTPTPKPRRPHQYKKKDKKKTPFLANCQFPTKKSNMSARELRSPHKGRNSAIEAYNSRLNSPFRSQSIDSERLSDNIVPFRPPPPLLRNSQQSQQNISESHYHEEQPKWSIFPKLKVLDITLSEPRDVLQSERTLLSFVRFSTSLYFAATGMIMGFHLRTSGKEHHHLPNFQSGTFNRVMAGILILLAFATLIISGVNYFRTVRRYSQKRIHTYGFNNATMIVCVTAVVLTLIGINVALIVDRLLDK